MNTKNTNLTDCILVNKIIENINEILSAMFPSGGLINTETIDYNNKSYQIFTNPDEYFTYTIYLDLPSYLGYTNFISLINPTNTWDSFYLYTNNDDYFNIYLAEEYSDVVAPVGWPICSNTFYIIYSFIIDQILIKNLFSTLNISATTGSCNLINSQSYTYPCTITCNPSSKIAIFIQGESGWGNCWGDYVWSCEYNCSGLCLKDATIWVYVFETIYLTLSGEFSITGDLNFTVKIADDNSSITVSEISLTNFGNSSVSNISYTFSVSDSAMINSILNLVGGIASIKNNINAIISKTIDNLLLAAIQEVNNLLLDYSITIS